MEVDTTIVDLIEAANTLYAQWPDARPNIHQEEDTPQNLYGSYARHAVESGRPGSLTRLICRYHSVRLGYL